MEYVMVPVPEELVEDVQRFLRWQSDVATAEAQPDFTPDSGAVDALVAGFDEGARTLLRLVLAPPGDVVPTLLVLAETLGVAPRQVLGTGYELNLSLATVGGLGAMMRLLPDELPLYERALVMPEPTASMVRAALGLPTAS